MRVEVIDGKAHVVIDDPKGFKPFALDFAAGSLRWRGERHQHERIVRAIGVRPSDGTVVDGTGGFLSDAWILAAAGYSVLALEIQPIIFRVAADALERARRDPATEVIARRLDFKNRSVLDFLRAEPDLSGRVLYLDPMFEDASKSLSRKELRILQIAGWVNTPWQEVVTLARQLGALRTVVKRPRTAPPICVGAKGRITGRQVRFDLY